MDHPLTPDWTPEDERLLAELGELEAMRALWALAAPYGAAPLPERSRTLARAASATDAGRRAVHVAAGGDARPFAAFLAEVELATAAPPLVHGLACYLDRLGDAFATARERARSDDVGARTDELAEAERAVRARSLAAWARLYDERAHLVALATRVAGDSLDAAACARAAEDAATSALSELAARARGGAVDATDDAASALILLARVSDACRIAGVSAKTARHWVVRADGARADAIEVALLGITDALREARQASDLVRAAVPAFEKARRIWEWAGNDEAVEKLAVDELTTIAWDLYRVANWAGLRALLAPVAALFESLESRVLRDPAAQLAYAAKCAQALVFMSEAETDRGREWQLAERALAICPTHRNGRLVLAGLCLNQALRTLEYGTLFSLGRDIAAVEPLILRAEKLYPQSKKLADAKKRLEDAKRRAGVSVSP